MLRFYKETALSLSRSVNFIPSSLTTMLSFASVHGFLLQIAIWLQELLLTRVYGPMGASWSPAVILSFPLNPETGHHFPQQLLHNPKSTWVTLQLQTVQCASHSGFLGKKDVTQGKEVTPIWDGACFFTGKTNLSEVLLCHDEAEMQRVKLGSQAGYATVHLTPTSGPLMPL